MEFKKEDLPKHIAIIMDGNRRWAKAKGKPVAFGHKEGAKTLGKIVRNWKRSEDEVNALMLLLQNYIEDYSKRADSENIKVQFLGDTTAFSPRMQKGITDCIERTKNNTGITFNIALNYGGRAEILKAVKEIAEDIEKQKIKIEDINEELMSDKLYTAGQPDPDLLIRTSGEIRLSNFLPWQLVYSEFLFVEKYWPDFSEEDLDNCIIEYQKRTRKFGAN